MDAELVADSEEECQLRLSPAISPGIYAPNAFSVEIPSIHGYANPGLDASSSISQFTSTVASAGHVSIDPPILPFPTTQTRASFVTSAKVSKPSPSEVINLSDDDYDAGLSNSTRKGVRDAVNFEEKPRKPRTARSTESGKDTGKTGQFSMDELIAAGFFEPLNNMDDSDEYYGGKKSKNKPTKQRKNKSKDGSNDVTNILLGTSDRKPSPAPTKSRKRKLSEALDSNAPKPTKKHRKFVSEDAETAIPESPKKPKHTHKAKETPDSKDAADSEPDELLLKENTTELSSTYKGTTENPKTIPRVSSSSSVFEPDSMAPKRTQVSRPSSKSSTMRVTVPPKSPEPSGPEQECNRLSSPSKESSTPPKNLPEKDTKPSKPISRPSLLPQSTAYHIPKRGSISSLLIKTGTYAPLSSSRLTKTSGSRIAPLHLERKTPPLPPPPIPRPKKKKDGDDEDEDETELLNGMTEKQRAKYLEEKRKKAWYSP